MRLLLVEDEKELSRALVTILKHNNYTVDAVYNGLDALEYIETGIYDGVVLDVMLPALDGFSVLKKVREAGNDIPILMLTARAEVDDRVEGLDLGANDYLTKPFAMKELIARIRAMLRNKSDCKNTSASNQISFGNVTLDKQTYEVFTCEKRVKLIGKEYQILELMLANPNVVISVERFIEKIWGFNTEVEQNVVWVNISTLRKKLSSIDANVKIKATRNVGYSLEALDD